MQHLPNYFRYDEFKSQLNSKIFHGCNTLKKKKKNIALLLLKSIHKEITTSIIIEKHMCKVNPILQGALIPNDSNIWTSHGKFNDV